MRRKDREVTSRTWMLNVLQEAEHITLGLIEEDGSPYVVPVRYGFDFDRESDTGHLYVHGAVEGHRVDLVKRDPRVAFNVAVETTIVPRSELKRGYQGQFKSVSGTGVARIVTEPDEKRVAIAKLKEHDHGVVRPLTDEQLERVGIMIIDIKTMTGKIRNLDKPDLLNKIP